MAQLKVLRIGIIAIFVTALLIMPHLNQVRVYANHTTKGSIFWYNWCKSGLGNLLVSENCQALVSKHDRFGHGLSAEGWRVAWCLGGGVLSFYIPQTTLEKVAKSINLKCGGN